MEKDFVICILIVFSMPVQVVLLMWASSVIENAWWKHKAKKTMYTPLTDEDWEDGIPF